MLIVERDSDVRKHSKIWHNPFCDAAYLNMFGLSVMCFVQLSIAFFISS